MNKFLVEPKPYKRIFAYVVDVLLVIIVGVVFLATIGVGGVVNSFFGGEEASNNVISFSIDSGLAYNKSENSLSYYVYNADGTEDKNNGYVSTPNGEKGYEAYLDKVWYYYTEFLNVEKNPDERVIGREGYSSSDYYKYAYEEVFGFGSDNAGNNKYFTYKTEAGVIDYTAKPVLNQNYQQKADISDQTTLNELLSYFFKEETTGAYSGLYYDAILDLEGTYYRSSSVQTYYYQETSKLSMSIWLTEIVCYSPFGLIFLFIIPLCSKQGQTIGKKLFKVGVVDDRGFYMSWTQRITRPLLVSLHFALLLIPNVMFGFGVYAISAAISFFFMTFGRKRNNIHEKITHTVVVDISKSVIFKNVIDKTEYLETHGLNEYGNPDITITELDGQPKVVLTKEE